MLGEILVALLDLIFVNCTAVGKSGVNEIEESDYLLYRNDRIELRYNHLFQRADPVRRGSLQIQPFRTGFQLHLHRQCTR